MNKHLGVFLSALAPLFAVVILGCASPRLPANRRTIPDANINHCIALCTSAGLELRSLVVVANQTGCVCSFPDPSSCDSGASATAAGGAVAAIIARQQPPPPPP